MNKNELTLKYFKRYGKTKHYKSFLGSQVHIVTNNGMWCHDAKGYTYNHYVDAGLWDFEVAMDVIADLGPEKYAKVVRKRTYLVDGEPVQPLYRPVGSNHVFCITNDGPYVEIHDMAITDENGEQADTKIFSHPKFRHYG